MIVFILHPMNDDMEATSVGKQKCDTTRKEHLCKVCKKIFTSKKS